MKNDRWKEFFIMFSKFWIVVVSVALYLKFLVWLWQ